MKRKSSTEHGSNKKTRRQGVKRQIFTAQPTMNDPQPSSTLPPRASLLGLPTEIRLQILGYLLPDSAIIPHRMQNPILCNVHPMSGENDRQYCVESFKQAQKDHAQAKDIRPWLQGYEPLRENLESCWPSIMRVNHQLYAESLPLAYDHKTFTAEIWDSGDYLSLCGKDYPENEGRLRWSDIAWSDFYSEAKMARLFVALRNIQSLKLNINFPPMDGDEIEFPHFLFMTATLVHFLTATGVLKQLVIKLRPFGYGNGGEPNYLESIKAILEPLQTLRSLDSARIVLGCAHFQTQTQRPDLDDEDEDKEPDDFFYDKASRDNLLEHLKAAEKVMCSKRDPAEKQPMIESFLQYMREYNRVWMEYRDVLRNEAIKFCYELENDLLDQAWQACKRGDLEAFKKVKKERGARRRMATEVHKTCGSE